MQQGKEGLSVQQHLTVRQESTKDELERMKHFFSKEKKKENEKMKLHAIHRDYRDDPNLFLFLFFTLF